MYLVWKAEVRAKYIQLLALDAIAKNACEIKVEIEEIANSLCIPISRIISISRLRLGAQSVSKGIIEALLKKQQNAPSWSVFAYYS